MSSLLRYLIKLKFLFLIFILAVFLATVACNIFLFVSKPSITKSLNKYFSQSISIENAIFVPPNYIFLKNISISETVSSEDTQLSFIPTIFIKFSLAKLVLKKTLTLCAVSLYNPRMEYVDFCSFIKENYKQIIDFIRSLPQEDFKFHINQARLDLAGKDTKAASILADFYLNIKDRFMLASGSMKKGASLHYKFSGSLLEDSFFLHNLELTKDNLYSQLSGEIQKDSLKINGLAFIDTLSRKRSEEKNEANIIEKIKSFLRNTPKYPDATFLSHADAKIFDIDCLINFSFPQIQIEKLNFTLNKVPFGLKGDFIFSQPLSLDLTLSSYPGKIDELSGEDIKKLDLSIKGSLEEQVFNGDSSFSLNFVKKKNIRTPLEKVKLSLKNLALDFTRYPQPTMNAGEIDLLCLTESNSYKLFLQNLRVNMDLRDEFLKSFELNSSFYGGNLNGEGKINIKRFPPRITSSLTIENASAHKLDELLKYFAKVDGKMSSSMTFSNYPRLGLNGFVNIRGGYLNKLDFFEWLSGFFDLPSLSVVDFRNSSFNFSIDSKGVSMHDLELDAEDVNLNGYFSIAENGLVASKLSLALTKDLMEESSKLTPLLNILRREDFESLTFDFQLSGNFESMNFQWLRSELKSKLQHLIPDFVERKLQRNIESAIESISQ
ncbi:MAG: hypothetical protein ABIG56_04690 [Candidatus Omnitrophota bacterium]